MTSERQPAESRLRSSWTVECGPFRISRQRFAPPADAAAGGGSAGRVAALVLAAGIAVAVPLCLTRAETLGHAAYAVSQSLPPAAAPLAPRRHHRAGPRHAPAAATARPVEAPTGTADADRAAALAWDTGDSQDWTDGAAHGVVVPGEIERSGDLVCRSFARLTRQAGRPDAVEQWRRCSAVASGG